LWQAHDPIKDFGLEIAFEGNTLHKACPITDEQKTQFALVCTVVNPALDGYFLSNVF
jgi:hypothetical protein